MIVVDASALLEVLLRTPAAAATDRRLFQPGQTLHAPHLVDVGIGQVIRRYAADGEISAERGSLALDDFGDFRVHRASGIRDPISPPTMRSMWCSPKCWMRRCRRATGVLPPQPAIVCALTWYEPIGVVATSMMTSLGTPGASC
jgi:hypothetical protein